MQAILSDNVDVNSEPCGQLPAHSRQIEQVETRSAVVFDDNIDVARGMNVPRHCRSENIESRHASGSEGMAFGLDESADVVGRHVTIIGWPEAETETRRDRAGWRSAPVGVRPRPRWRFLFPAAYSPAAASAARSCCASAFCLASRSSPVCWSTTFIDSRTLPRSSKPSSFTFTLSPSLTTSLRSEERRVGEESSCSMGWALRVIVLIIVCVKYIMMTI